MKSYFCTIIALLFIISACSSGQVITEVSPETLQTSLPPESESPTNTPPPSSTPAPTETSTPVPTETSIPSPTFTSSPTITPTSVAITIEADGSGDYATLEEAVRKASDSAIIKLGTGVYELDQGLIIKKTIKIIGNGMNETEIVSADIDHVITAYGLQSFGLEGITIRHNGDKYAHVVVLESVDNFDIQNCRFTGAVYNEEFDKGGYGLRISQSKHGLVKNSEALENNNGIFIDTSEGVTIENNILNNNNQFGIAVGYSSDPLIQGNECSENGYSGILAMNNANPTLVDNSCAQNGESGIIFTDNTKGNIQKNNVSNNKFSGITLMGNAKPIIEENNASENLRDGISLYENAQSEIISNECSQNKYDGIAVNDGAHPRIVGNLIQDNGNNGIVFFDESGGEATQNECSGNVKCIHIDDTASPEVSNNNCHDNLVGDPETDEAPEAVETSPDAQVYSASIEEFLCRIEDIEVEFDMFIPEEPLQLSSEDYLNIHPDPDFANEYVENAEWNDYWYLNMRYTKFDSSGETLLGTMGSINCSVLLHETIDGAVYAFENPFFYPPEEISPTSTDIGLGQQSMLEIYDSNSRLLFRYQNITAHVEVTQMEPKDGSEFAKAIAENMLERIQSAFNSNQ